VGKTRVKFSSICRWSGSPEKTKNKKTNLLYPAREKEGEEDSSFARGARAKSLLCI